MTMFAGLSALGSLRRVGDYVVILCDYAAFLH